MSEIVINGIIDDSSEMQGKMKYAIGAPGPQGPQGPQGVPGKQSLEYSEIFRGYSPLTVDQLITLQLTYFNRRPDDGEHFNLFFHANTTDSVYVHDCIIEEETPGGIQVKIKSVYKITGEKGTQGNPVWYIYSSKIVGTQIPYNSSCFGNYDADKSPSVGDILISSASVMYVVSAYSSRSCTLSLIRDLKGDPALTYKSHWTVTEEPSTGSQEPMSIGNSFNRTPIVDDDFILVCDGQQSVAGRSWITNNKVTGVYSTYISYTCISVTETTGRAAISASGILKGDGRGNVSSAVPGTDYQTPLTTEEAETLGIDATPTASSNNLVKSGGVKSYVDTAVSTVLGITVSELANLLGGDA